MASWHSRTVNSTKAARRLTQLYLVLHPVALAEFMRKLDIYSTSGGTTGGRTRLRNQMRRLFGCMVSLTYADAHVEATMNAPIARTTEYWWRESQPDAREQPRHKAEIGATLSRSSTSSTPLN